MPTCPSGHESATDDYCDTCGAPITAGPAPPAPGEAPEAPEAPGASHAPAPRAPEAPAPESAAGATVACAACGAPVAGRFCESCGHDTQSTAPRPVTVTLTLSADRGHWERMVGSGEPAFPAAVPALSFELPGDRATLGRVRSGVPADVDIPLTGAAADPAVSHHQCEFERPAGGTTWVVRDSGSANGTWINDAGQPLAPGEAHTLTEGDRIFIGAWTCLTVHLTPAPEPG